MDFKTAGNVTYLRQQPDGKMPAFERDLLDL